MKVLCHYSLRSCYVLPTTLPSERTKKGCKLIIYKLSVWNQILSILESNDFK